MSVFVVDLEIAFVELKVVLEFHFPYLSALLSAGVMATSCTPALTEEGWFHLN